MLRDLSSPCYAGEAATNSSSAPLSCTAVEVGCVIDPDRQHLRRLVLVPDRWHRELAFSVLRPEVNAYWRVIASVWVASASSAEVGRANPSPRWVKTGRVQCLPTVTSPSIPVYCCRLSQILQCIPLCLGTCWSWRRGVQLLHGHVSNRVDLAQASRPLFTLGLGGTGNGCWFR
jgi:hypothetical protein